MSGLSAKEFDVVIDLNINENIFYSVITSMANTRFRVGFKKRNSERFYNLIIINNEIKPEISYRNLLNSLQMF
jgi:ADP-heptose:LPS heptosyltransferase